jgi:hypothetical protein
MNSQTKTHWLQLCEEAASGQDPERQSDVAREIKRILEDEIQALVQRSRIALIKAG